MKKLLKEIEGPIIVVSATVILLIVVIAGTLVVEKFVLSPVVKTICNIKE